MFSFYKSAADSVMTCLSFLNEVGLLVWFRAPRKAHWVLAAVGSVPQHLSGSVLGSGDEVRQIEERWLCVGYNVTHVTEEVPWAVGETNLLHGEEARNDSTGGAVWGRRRRMSPAEEIARGKTRSWGTVARSGREEQSWVEKVSWWHAVGGRAPAVSSPLTLEFIL